MTAGCMQGGERSASELAKSFPGAAVVVISGYEIRGQVAGIAGTRRHASARRRLQACTHSAPAAAGGVAAGGPPAAKEWTSTEPGKGATAACGDLWVRAFADQLAGCLGLPLANLTVGCSLKPLARRRELVSTNSTFQGRGMGLRVPGVSWNGRGGSYRGHGMSTSRVPWTAEERGTFEAAATVVGAAPTAAIAARTGAPGERGLGSGMRRVARALLQSTCSSPLFSLSIRVLTGGQPGGAKSMRQRLVDVLQGWPVVDGLEVCAPAAEVSST